MTINRSMELQEEYGNIEKKNPYPIFSRILHFSEKAVSNFNEKMQSVFFSSTPEMMPQKELKYIQRNRT
jgi:hypothetical protein